MNIRPFQIVLLGIFGLLAIVAVLFFATFQGSGSNSEKAYGESVIIWGTLSSSAFQNVFNEIIVDDKAFQVVRYIQKDARTFDFEFINAIAEGRAPDLIVLPSQSIVTHREKLIAISPDTISTRTFRDRYIDGAEIFLFSEGIYGVPFAVDPLVMFWNRDLLASAGLAAAPTTWTEVQDSIVPSLTVLNSSLVPTQSGIAFGEYANIRNAKPILSLLLLQTGTSIVSEENQRYRITLGERSSSTLPPADAALSFYTRFSLPSQPQYSWSRSLPEDRQKFIGGTLGLYFGFGSEYRTIINSNPNLNFDVAPVPQDAGATVKRNFGTVYAFAIPRAAANKSGAFAVAETLAGPTASDLLTAALGLSPALRSVIAQGATDPYRQTLLSSALITRAWLDPSPEESKNVFKLMIEDVTSGRSRVSEAIEDAIGRLELLFR